MTDKEINFLIAEKVIGYRVIPPSVHEETGFENCGYFVVKEETEDEDAIWISQFEFCPTTDIKDTWEVVKKLETMGDFLIAKDFNDNEWKTELTVYGDAGQIDRHLYAKHELPQMAICLLALKTI